MKIVLHRGPMSGRVVTVRDDMTRVTFNYLPKKKSRLASRWSGDYMDPMVPGLRTDVKTCIYELVQFVDPMTGLRFPAMRPDGAVFFEWTEARKDSNAASRYSRR